MYGLTKFISLPLIPMPFDFSHQFLIEMNLSPFSCFLYIVLLIYSEHLHALNIHFRYRPSNEKLVITEAAQDAQETNPNSWLWFCYIPFAESYAINVF